MQGFGPSEATRATLDRRDPVSVDEIRMRAASTHGQIKSGKRAARQGTSVARITVAELAERYFREHVAVRCKPSTEQTYRYLICRHIMPELGDLPITMIGREHAAELHFRLRETPMTANAAVNALSRMLKRAKAWGLLPDCGDPCRFVKRYRKRRLERFLTQDEFGRIGEALARQKAKDGLWPSAVAAIRLLMLTGCRTNEILALRWEDVDLEQKEIRLTDTKTGPREVALSLGAVRVLEGLPRIADNPWVFARHGSSSRLMRLHHYWYQIRRDAELEDVRIHDLRHSFASRALALGEPLPMIGKLLGHKKIQTTARYAHIAVDSVKKSAARVANSIATDLDA